MHDTTFLSGQLKEMSTKICDFFLVKNMMEKDVRDLLTDHIMKCHRRYRLAIRYKGEDVVLADPERYGYYRKDHSSIAYSMYGNLIMEDLLDTFTPIVEEITQLNLNPNYSYFSLYEHGNTLEKHIDREDCEVTLSICLGQSPEKPWPIYISGEEFNLESGDGVIYQGREHEHWREPYKGEYVAQVFFHWTDKDGPNGNTIFDGRPYLGHPTENVIDRRRP